MLLNPVPLIQLLRLRQPPQFLPRDRLPRQTFILFSLDVATHARAFTPGKLRPGGEGSNPTTNRSSKSFNEFFNTTFNEIFNARVRTECRGRQNFYTPCGRKVLKNPIESGYSYARKSGYRRWLSSKTSFDSDPRLHPNRQDEKALGGRKGHCQ